MVFEILAITKPSWEINIGDITNKIEKYINQTGGEVISSDIWGDRCLAYEIKDYMSGCYIYKVFECEKDDREKLHELLNQDEDILREMIILQSRG